MNAKCPNCSEFKYSKGITGKWSFGFWNLVVYFFSLTFIFGSPYKSNYDNYSNSTELFFGLPMVVWGFIIIVTYTPFILVRRYFHNKKNITKIMYCSNCNYRENI